MIDFDNLYSDSNNLLKYLQKNELETNKVFMDKQKTAVSEISAFNEISKLSNETVTKIKQIYKDDFYIFGYNNTS